MQLPMPRDAARPAIRDVQQILPIQGDQIRVVDLLPAPSPEDPICLECRVVSLAKGAQFEALSYVWGDVTDVCSVKIAAHTVGITRVLYVAFQHLRWKSENRTLWVDQLCINQSDDVEKSHQVGLMRTIYKKCSQCLIWLGAIPDNGQFSISDAKIAFDFIQATADHRAHRAIEADEVTHLFFSGNQSGYRARRAFESLIMGGNPWWSRVWTLQEASLPVAATLHWGTLTLPLKTIEEAAAVVVSGWVCGVPSNTEVADDYLDLMSNFLYPVRGLSIARRGESPLDTLMRWRYRKATDPRDKVYGFAGLFKSRTLIKIPALLDISYTISPTVLFAQVTIDLIRFTEDLRVFIGAREVPHITPALPTWAIDFASSHDIGPRQTRWWHHSHRYGRWSASKRLKFQLEVDSDDRVLRMIGIFVDHVEKVSDVYFLDVKHEVDDTKLRSSILASHELLQDFQEMHEKDLSADYIGGGTVKDAFWRTLLGNLIMEEVPTHVPQDHDMYDFEDYVKDGTSNRLTLSLHGFVPNHAFFITSKGYLGIGPADTRTGDRVCILGGGRVPFLVRPECSCPIGITDDSRKHQLIGDVYLHGIMRGEMTINTESPRTTIELI